LRYVLKIKNEVMAITIESNSEEILIKLPIDTSLENIQQILKYFTYIDLVSKSKAEQEQIDDIAKEIKKGWWLKNKDRFKG
jgi:uncharacterized Ntn-hydrolase superfamily protein